MRNTPVTVTRVKVKVTNDKNLQRDKEKNSRILHTGKFAARLDVGSTPALMVKTRSNSSIIGRRVGGIAVSSALTVLLW